MNKRRDSIRNQNESNKEIKQNERKQKGENIIDEDFDSGRFFKLVTTNKKYVNGLNLLEIKNAIVLDHKCDFEMIGPMLIGRIEHKANIRFKNIHDFESYINAIDIDYDSEDVTFTSYVYKLNTSQFIKVNRSQYVKVEISK